MNRRVVCWSGSLEYGVWWIGLGRWRLLLNAPWREPLYSERNGFVKTLRLPLGWRVKSRLVNA